MTKRGGQRSPDAERDRDEALAEASAAPLEPATNLAIAGPPRPTKWKPWDLDQARELVRELHPHLTKAGWCIGLTGSVLWSGASDNDLDVIVYPLDSSRANTTTEVVKALRDGGMFRVLHASRVVEEWRSQGSNDSKMVEIWASGSRRVDVFYMGTFETVEPTDTKEPA